jgi:enamine deaminase RidA (YjgF/YER057c/UK114 family)
MIAPVEGLGQPVGLYSHAVPAPDGTRLVCISGQLSVDADGTSIGTGDFDVQMRQVFSNLATVVEAAGGSLADVLKMTTYLVDPDHIDDFYRVREELFADLFPAGVFPGNTLLVIQRLVRPEFLIEIEAIAAVPAEEGVR